MPKIGVKKLYYAICTKDEEDGVVYGTPKRIVGLNTIEVNPTVQRATAYGDDVPLETASNISETAKIGTESSSMNLQLKKITLQETEIGYKFYKSYGFTELFRMPVYSNDADIF